MYTGPKLEQSDLVFGYDTGYGAMSSTRHYKGEPATNLITAGLPGYFGSGGETIYKNTLYGLNSDSGVFQRNFVTNPALANTGTYNNNAGLYKTFTTSALSSNTEYLLVSFDFYMIVPYVRHSASGTGLNGYMGVTYTDGSGGNHGWNTSLMTPNAGDDWNNNSDYIGQWRKIALYVDLSDAKTPSVINAMYIYNDRTLTGQGVFTNFIITQHATLPTGPIHYTSGTRSSTQSLIDLKGTSAMDVANVSFEDGQVKFDGSNDNISVPYSSVLDTPAGATYELIIYPIGQGEILSRGISDSGSSPDNPRIYWGTNGSIYFDWSITGQDTYVTTTAGDCPANQFSYVVCRALPGEQLRVYVNGVEAVYNTNVQTLPSSGVPNTNHPIVIGGATWIPRYFAGNIPVVKLHKRALSLSEIKENFKAYKNRFNI